MIDVVFMKERKHQENYAFYISFLVLYYFTNEKEEEASFTFVSNFRMPNRRRKKTY